MRKITLGIQRTLSIISNASTKEVTIRIEELEEIGGGWACHYSLAPLEPPGRKIYGEDAIQALQLCLRYVESMLRQGHDEFGWKIRWLSDDDLGGFNIDLGSVKS